MKKSPCDPPNFGEQDWDRFDFKKWKLSDLDLGSPASSFADLTQSLLDSSEWQRHFKMALPTMKEVILNYFQQRADALKAESAEQTRVLKDGAVRAKEDNNAFESELKNAASPPHVKPDPASFVVGAKIVEEETRIGLPGLYLRLVAENNQDALAEAVTDQDGNALLFLTKEQAETLARGKIEPEIQVLTPEGKCLHRAEQAVCPRPNHTQTWLAALRSSADLKPHLAHANEIKTEREIRGDIFAAEPQRMTMHHDDIQRELKCRLDHTNSIIEQIREERDNPLNVANLFSAPAPAGRGKSESPRRVSEARSTPTTKADAKVTEKLASSKRPSETPGKPSARGRKASKSRKKTAQSKL